MAAMTYMPSRTALYSIDTISPSVLGSTSITVVTLIVLFGAIISSLVDRRFSAYTLALESSEQRYRLLFERTPAGVYRTTLDGRILEMNDACGGIFGFPYGYDYSKYSITEIYACPEDRKKFLEILQEQKTVKNLVHRLRRHDGKPLWLLENAVLLQSHERAEEVIEGTLIDITERMKIEEELQQSEEKYRFLAERVPAITYIAELGREGRWKYVSPRIAQVLGFTPEEWLADRSLWLSRIHPDDSDRIFSLEAEYMVKGEFFRAEDRILNCDGNVVWVQDEA